MGVVEEEVTTEIIKTEIQTDEGSDQFIVTSENLEYEEDVNIKKVFVSKVSLSPYPYLQLILSFLFKHFHTQSTYSKLNHFSQVLSSR